MSYTLHHKHKHFSRHNVKKRKQAIDATHKRFPSVRRTAKNTTLHRADRNKKKRGFTIRSKYKMCYPVQVKYGNRHNTIKRKLRLMKMIAEIQKGKDVPIMDEEMTDIIKKIKKLQMISDGRHPARPRSNGRMRNGKNYFKFLNIKDSLELLRNKIQPSKRRFAENMSATRVMSAKEDRSKERTRVQLGKGKITFSDTLQCRTYSSNDLPNQFIDQKVERLTPHGRSARKKSPSPLRSCRQKRTPFSSEPSSKISLPTLEMKRKKIHSCNSPRSHRKNTFTPSPALGCDIKKISPLNLYPRSERMKTLPPNSPSRCGRNKNTPPIKSRNQKNPEGHTVKKHCLHERKSGVNIENKLENGVEKRFNYSFAMERFLSHELEKLRASSKVKSHANIPRSQRNCRQISCGKQISNKKRLYSDSINEKLEKIRAHYNDRSNDMAGLGKLGEYKQKISPTKKIKKCNGTPFTDLDNSENSLKTVYSLEKIDPSDVLDRTSAETTIAINKIMEANKKRMKTKDRKRINLNEIEDINKMSMDKIKLRMNLHDETVDTCNKRMDTSIRSYESMCRSEEETEDKGTYQKPKELFPLQWHRSKPRTNKMEDELDNMSDDSEIQPANLKGLKLPLLSFLIRSKSRKTIK